MDRDRWRSLVTNDFSICTVHFTHFFDSFSSVASAILVQSLGKSRHIGQTARNSFHFFGLFLYIALSVLFAILIFYKSQNCILIVHLPYLTYRASNTKFIYLILKLKQHDIRFSFEEISFFDFCGIFCTISLLKNFFAQL